MATWRHPGPQVSAQLAWCVQAAGSLEQRRGAAAHSGPPQPAQEQAAAGAAPGSSKGLRSAPQQCQAESGQEEARGEEGEGWAAGASLTPVGGSTVTPEGRFTAWRVPDYLHKQLAASAPHLLHMAANNFWRHEVKTA